MKAHLQKSPARITGMLALAAAFFLVHSAQAQVTYYWNTTTLTPFNTGAAWSDNATSGGTTGIVPGSLDTAVFNQSSVNGNETASVTANINVAGFIFNNTGTTVLSQTANRVTTIGSGGILINADAGAVTLGQSSNSLGVTVGASQTWTNNSTGLLTIRNAFAGASTGVNATLTLAGSGTGGVSFSGVVHNGAGTVALEIDRPNATVTIANGTSTYSGGTTIKSGTLTAGGSGSLGTGGVLLGNTTGSSDAALLFSGTATPTNAITVQAGNSGTLTLRNSSGSSNVSLSGAININNNLTLTNSSSGTFSLSNTVTLGTNATLTASGTTTISGPIGETGGSRSLTKAGSGTLALTGANTYTGATTVNAGTLTLGSGGSLDSSSALAVGGTGIFDFSGAPAATQTVNGLNANQGFGTVNNTVSGTTLSLGSVTHSVGGMLHFATTTGNINTSSSNANGIIGPWAFLGTGATLDYAVSNGDGNAITSLGAATVLPDGPGDATTNYTLAGPQTQTANTVGNTLRYTGGANTLALGTTSLGLGGLMNAGTGLLTITGTAANPGLVTTGELAITSNTQGITISSVISGAGSVVYGGPSAGMLILSGANTYDGGTIINSGVLRAQNNTALGNTSGAVLVESGAKLQLQGGVNIANDVTLKGGNGLESNSGNNTISGTVSLLANSTMTAINAGGTSLTVGNVSLGANSLTVNAQAGTQGLAFITGTITGSGASGIIKAGNGPLTISNDQTSTYSGTTTLQLGTLILGNSGALGTGTFAFNTNNDATATIRSLDGNALTLANVVTFGGGNANSVRVFGAASGGTGSLTFTDTTNISLGSTIRRFDVKSTTQFEAGFTGTGGITQQTGTGTLILDGTSTYTGATTVNAGTLLVNGSLASGSAVTVGASGTLGGSGTINGATTVNGSLNPGNSPGILTFGSTLSLTGTTTFEIDGITRGTLYDGINVTGALTNGGILSLNFGSAFLTGGETFDLFALSGGQSGDFSAINLIGSYAGSLTNNSGVWTGTVSGLDFTYTQSTGDLGVVPEPSTWALLAFSLMTVIFFRRRKI